MKNKINATTVIKIVGWVATAVGGILVSLASDKQMQEQVDATEICSIIVIIT